MPEMKFGPPAEMLEMPAHITVGQMVAQADYLDLLRDGINAQRKAILSQHEAMVAMNKQTRALMDHIHNLGKVVDSQQRMIHILGECLGLLDKEG